MAAAEATSDQPLFRKLHNAVSSGDKETVVKTVGQIMPALNILKSLAPDKTARSQIASIVSELTTLKGWPSTGNKAKAYTLINHIQNGFNDALQTMQKHV